MDRPGLTGVLLVGVGEAGAPGVNEPEGASSVGRKDNLRAGDWTGGFDGDPGSLPRDTRRTLVRLLQRPYLTTELHPEL